MHITTRNNAIYSPSEDPSASRYTTHNITPEFYDRLIPYIDDDYRITGNAHAYLDNYFPHAHSFYFVPTTTPNGDHDNDHGYIEAYFN